MTQILVEIDRIKVERARREPGDIEGLAASIEAVGLLHPVVVDPDYRLIAGRRRLLAARVLGWSQILCRVLPLTAAELRLQAERDENECRKPLTPTERVAVVEALVAAARERGEVITQKDAVEAAGVGSRADFYRAKKVVEKGTPELVEAMDAGEVSVYEADQIADLPAEKQPRATAKAKEAKDKKEKKTPAPVPPPEAGDAWEPEPEGAAPEDVVPEHLRSDFGDETLETLLRDLRKYATALKSVGKWNYWLNTAEIRDALGKLKTLMESAIPDALCPDCKGARGGCSSCRKMGWVPAWRLEELREVG